jgi:membrane fusion protein (multidrug efflux system)
MRPGQPVEVKVDALGGRKLKGVVDSFSPGTGAQFALIPPANATGNFTKIVQRVPVRIRIDVPADVRPVILPGLSVTVAVDTRPASGQ